MAFIKNLTSFLIIFIPFILQAQLKLGKIFSDNMVIQQNKLVVFYGKYLPGEEVSIRFSFENKTTTTKADSTWEINFPPQKANNNPQEIYISSNKENIKLKNILIGDVWLCIGQSNMEFTLSSEQHYNAESPNLNHPLIRFFNPVYAGKYIYGKAFTDSILTNLNEYDFFKGNWENCNKSSAPSMSAIGYYFAKIISEDQQIPIGIINLSIGGAPIESFINTETLLSHPVFKTKAIGNWLENEDLPVWIRERGKQNLAGNSDENLNHAYKPGFAYQSGIAPIIEFPVAGILWYQGESNAQEIERVLEYKDLQKLMVDDYRKTWNSPELPFYYVQLSSIDTLHYRSHYWPEFRNEQRVFLYETKNTGMAVSSDVGNKNDVHPADKKTIAERLAKWAKYDNYGNRNILPSGPLPVEAMFSGEKIIIKFEYTGSGLKTAGMESLRGFSIDGIKEIPAVIKGHTIEIEVNEKPEFIYYGWKPFSDANLLNSENLPASTFRVKVQSDK